MCLPNWVPSLQKLLFSYTCSSYYKVKNLFNNSFPYSNPISKSIVGKRIKCFQETDSVKDSLKSGRPKLATNEKKSLDVLQCVIENPISHIKTYLYKSV